MRQHWLLTLSSNGRWYALRRYPHGGVGKNNAQSDAGDCEGFSRSTPPCKEEIALGTRFIEPGDKYLSRVEKPGQNIIEVVHGETDNATR